MRWTIALPLLAVMTASSARADAVGPPPSSCPVGSTPSASHAGPLCVPEPVCMTDLMCGGGEACEEVRLCVTQVACGGRIEPDAGPCFQNHVVGYCDGAGNCGVGTCEIFDACIPPGTAGGGGCGCTVGGRAPSALAVLASLALVASAMSRARDRRSRYRAAR